MTKHDENSSSPLSNFYSGPEMESRWRVSDTTLRKLEDSGVIRSQYLPGHGKRKYFLRSEIAAVEAQYSSNALDELLDGDSSPAQTQSPPTPSGPSTAELAARIESLESQLRQATAPRPPDPVADARRRQAVLDAFDDCVDFSEMYREKLKQAVQARLDDPTFTADQVEALVDVAIRIRDGAMQDTVAAVVRPANVVSNIKPFNFIGLPTKRKDDSK